MQTKALAGLNKKSFSMYFCGGEIWFEHLDGIYEYTDLAIEKLEKAKGWLVSEAGQPEAARNRIIVCF